MITIKDFQKLEIKIGEVVAVEKVTDSRKLLKFTFDFGDHQRQILAGMAPFFAELTDLVGLKLPVLLNIEPANFAGHVSEGMILAADNGDKPIFLVPKEDIMPGSIVK